MKSDLFEALVLLALIGVAVWTGFVVGQEDCRRQPQAVVNEQGQYLGAVCPNTSGWRAYRQGETTAVRFGSREAAVTWLTRPLPGE